MNLKAIRAEKGLAQERLALEAGVDRTVVSKIERAKVNPNLDLLTSPFKSQNPLGVGVRQPQYLRMALYPSLRQT